LDATNVEQAFHGILNEIYKIVTTREVYNESSDAGRGPPGSSKAIHVQAAQASDTQPKKNCC
jgi:hypothetical protein